MDLHGDLTATVGGDVVTFTYAVENRGDDPAELTFSSGQKFDLAVSMEGAEQFRWSDGRMFTMALESTTLEAGEVERFEVDWEPPGPGTYEAEAHLETTGDDPDARATTVVEV